MSSPPVAFRSDRALWRLRSAIWRDQPCRSRPSNPDGRSRPGASAHISRGVRPDGIKGAARVGLTCTALSVWPVGGSGRVPRVRMLRGFLLALRSHLCRIGSPGHAARSQLFALNVIFGFGRLGAVRRYLPDHGLVTRPGWGARTLAPDRLRIL